MIELSFNRKLEDAYRRMEAIEKALYDNLDREASLTDLRALERTTANYKVLGRKSIVPWMEMRQSLHDLYERVHG